MSSQSKTCGRINRDGHQPRHHLNRRWVCAFTMVEILTVLVIMAIIGSLGMESIANTESNMRADRAAREIVVAIRYSRMMSMTTGGTYGVEFNTSTEQFRVFQNVSGTYTTVTNTLGASGNYLVNLNSTPELLGTTMTASLAGQAASPYRLSFGPMGATSNSGTITLTFGGKTRTVSVPAVGEPVLQ